MINDPDGCSVGWKNESNRVTAYDILDIHIRLSYAPLDLVESVSEWDWESE